MLKDLRNYIKNSQYPLAGNVSKDKQIRWITNVLYIRNEGDGHAATGYIDRERVSFYTAINKWLNENDTSDLIDKYNVSAEKWRNFDNNTENN
jgi:hypothetical protein